MESLNQTRFSGADAGDARAKLSELKLQGTEQASEPAREPDAELQAQRYRAWVLREPAAVQTALALIRTDPELYGPVADILRRREELIDGTAEDGRRNRNFAPLLAGIMANERTAKVLDGAIDTTVEAETHVIKAELEQGEVYVPEIVIGSGPHAAIYNATRLTSGESALTVERDDAIGGTFARANGPAFRLNSRTRPESVDTKPVPGTPGNLNTLGSSAAVQLPDVTGEAYAMQHKLGEVTRVNHLLASRIATGMRLVDAEVVDDPAVNGLLRLTFEDTADTGDDEADQPAKTYTITTDRVIMASSISEPRTGFEQAGKSTTRILKQEARAFKETGSAQIMTSEQADEYFGNPDNAEALRGIRRAVVIGSGDGGRIRVEDLLGYSGIDRGPMQLDRVEKLIWIGQGSATKEEFERTVRPRYRSLGLEFPREDEPDYYSRIEPVNSKATKLKRDSETGSIIVVTEDGREIPADLVVLETGYRDTTGEIFSKLAARPERITKPEEVAARLDEVLGTDGAVVRFKPEVQESFGVRADISTSSLDRVNSNVRFQLARDATDASTTETMAFAKQVFFRPELIESIELPTSPSDQPVDVDNVIARAVDPAERAPERVIIQGDDEQARLKLGQEMQAVTTVEEAEKFIGLTIRYNTKLSINCESITGVKVSQDGTPQFTFQSQSGDSEPVPTGSVGVAVLGGILPTLSELESIDLPAALSQTASPDTGAVTLPDANAGTREPQPVILETQEQFDRFFGQLRQKIVDGLIDDPSIFTGLKANYNPGSQPLIGEEFVEPDRAKGEGVLQSTLYFRTVDSRVYNYYDIGELKGAAGLSKNNLKSISVPPALAAELGFATPDVEQPAEAKEAQSGETVLTDLGEINRLGEKLLQPGIVVRYASGATVTVKEVTASGVRSDFESGQSPSESVKDREYAKFSPSSPGRILIFNFRDQVTESVTLPPTLAAELGLAVTQAEELPDATAESNEPQSVVLDTREQLNKLTDTFREVVNGKLSVDDASMAGLRITYSLLDTPTAQLEETVSFDPTAAPDERLSSLVYRKDGTEFTNYRYSGAADVFDQLLVEQLTSVTLPPALAAELGFAAPDVEQSAEAKEVQVGETVLTDLDEINRLYEKLLQPGAAINFTVVRDGSSNSFVISNRAPNNVIGSWVNDVSPNLRAGQVTNYSVNDGGRGNRLFTFTDAKVESVTLPPELASQVLGQPNYGPDGKTIVSRTITDKAEIQKLGGDDLVVGMSVAADRGADIYDSRVITSIENDIVRYDKIYIDRPDRKDFDRLSRGEFLDLNVRQSSSVTIPEPPSRRTEVIVAEGQPATEARTITSKEEINRLKPDDIVPGMVLTTNSEAGPRTRTVVSVDDGVVSYRRRLASGKSDINTPFLEDIREFNDFYVRSADLVTIPNPINTAANTSFPAAPRPVNDGAVAESQPATEARTITSREEIDSLKIDDLVPGTVLTDNFGEVVTRTILSVEDGTVRYNRSPALGQSDPNSSVALEEDAPNFLDLYSRGVATSVTIPAAPRPVNDGAVVESQPALKVRTITDRAEIQRLREVDLVPGMQLTRDFGDGPVTRTVISIEDGRVVYEQNPASVATNIDSTKRSATINAFTRIVVRFADSVTIPMQANTTPNTSLPSAMKLSPQDAKPILPRTVERKVAYNPPSTRSGEPLTYQEVLTDPAEIQRYGDDIAKTVGSQIEFRTGDIEYARVIGIEPEAAGAVVFLRVKRKDRTVDSLEKTRASTFASEYLANPDISAVRIQRSVPAELVLGPDGEPIARKVKGVPVYLVGPGAQIPVTDAERAKSTAYKKIPDNAVALFRYAGKTEALANEFNTRPLPPATVGRVLPGREKLRQPKYLKSIPDTDIDAAFVPREIVEFPSEQIASTHVGRDEFRLSVGQLLRDYRLPAETSAISFDATVEDLQNGTSKLSVDGQPIPVSDIGSVFYQLIDDPTVRTAIKQHSDMRRGLSKHAQVVIPFIDGRVDVANISIQQVREPRLA